MIDKRQAIRHFRNLEPATLSARRQPGVAIKTSGGDKWRQAAIKNAQGPWYSARTYTDVFVKHLKHERCGCSWITASYDKNVIAVNRVGKGGVNAHRYFFQRLER